MKNTTNPAYTAKKKTYVAPSVEQVCIMHQTNLLSASGARHDKNVVIPSAILNGGQLG